ncbi:unnamed protein product [Pleuronectes platessa]|uniref:Uncharacterized protein n=1 Tax=Pleuronectes platessa TaxID=8262 RepID=A0A9N7YGI5_PLEPL|nr:unnamed protein product [Pleuronectes platessa]
MSLRDQPYAPPSVSELLEFLLSDRKPTGHVRRLLVTRPRSTGITHIVNAAHGVPIQGPGHCFHVNTCPRLYRDMMVDYYGVDADDAKELLSPFFYPTAQYILAALAMGGNRSAFLMIFEDLSLQEAVAAVRPHRDICPNPGFLRQLHSLDMSLEKPHKTIDISM